MTPLGNPRLAVSAQWSPPQGAALSPQPKPPSPSSFYRDTFGELCYSPVLSVPTRDLSVLVTERLPSLKRVPHHQSGSNVFVE